MNVRAKEATLSNFDYKNFIPDLTVCLHPAL